MEGNALEIRDGTVLPITDARKLTEQGITDIRWIGTHKISGKEIVEFTLKDGTRIKVFGTFVLDGDNSLDEVH